MYKKFGEVAEKQKNIGKTALIHLSLFHYIFI